MNIRILKKFFLLLCHFPEFKIFQLKHFLQMPRQLRKIQAFLEMPDFCKSPWQICPTWMYVNFKEILIQSHFIVPLMSQVWISDNTGSWNHTTFTRDIHKSPCIVLSTKCCLHVLLCDRQKFDSVPAEILVQM